MRKVKVNEKEQRELSKPNNPYDVIAAARLCNLNNNNGTVTGMSNGRDTKAHHKPTRFHFSS